MHQWKRMKLWQKNHADIYDASAKLRIGTLAQNELPNDSFMNLYLPSARNQSDHSYTYLVINNKHKTMK
jgi:hypothetical protein